MPLAPEKRTLGSHSVRIPSDLPADPSPRRRHRARWWIVGFVVLVIVLLVSLRSLANIYTDSLWFSSVDFHNVFSTLLVIKLGLFGVFGAIFFAVLWVNLVVCDRIAGHDVVLAQEDELVRRYQHYVRPYSGRIYVALAVILALIGASGTISQWNNWILFRHGGNFNVTDPLFHKDVGFYVFKMPFLIFCVDWTLAILIVTLAVTLIFHYLNGGIQPQRGIPRVRPPVKAHISVLLALIALDKAAGYVLQRWSLVNASDGYVNGAGYTDVHARLPAELLLVYVSIFAAGILLFNIRRQGWTLPVLAVGIWAFVALVVGIIYPALLQALKVNPAQSSLEAPYIQRNITATRTAYNLNHVSVQTVPGVDRASRPSQAVINTQTIDNIRQWDPDPSISLADVPAPPGDQVLLHVPLARRRPLRPGGRRSRPCSSASARSRRRAWCRRRGSTRTCSTRTATARPSRWPTRRTTTTRSSGWAACRPAPPRACPRSSEPRRLLRARRVGLRGGEHQAARGRLPDRRTATTSRAHYKGNGGVQLSSIFTQAMFALRLGRLQPADLEPDHRQVTDHVRARPGRHGAEGGALPQLRPRPLRRDQRPATSTGSSTGTRRRRTIPTRRTPDSQQVAIGSTLPSSYNYVRNSVKVVIDAYSGKMTFYDIDPSDPILQAYSAAFPGMFVPVKDMPAAAEGPPALPRGHLLDSVRHLRALPPDEPGSAFYAASNAWQLSPTAGAGPQSQALLAENTYNNQGQLVSTTPARMAPQYQVYSLPNTPPQDQIFTISDGFVPAAQSSLSSSTQNFNLTAWMVGQSDPGRTATSPCTRCPQGTIGPANADAEISANNTVSSRHHAAGPAAGPRCCWARR